MVWQDMMVIMNVALNSLQPWRCSHTNPPFFQTASAFAFFFPQRQLIVRDCTADRMWLIRECVCIFHLFKQNKAFPHTDESSF